MIAEVQTVDKEQPEDPVEAFNERYLEDLKRMKEEEKPLSDGRRRWFNQEIEKLEGELE